MASFNVFINASAKKELRRISKPYLQKIVDAIGLLQQDPRPFGVKLLRGEDRHYRLRQGDYRIVYDVDDAAQVVTIIKVGHRREVYDA